MGRKSSMKGHQGPAAPEPSPASRPNKLLLGAIAVAIVAIAAFAFWPGESTPASASSTAADSSSTAADQTKAKAPEPSAEITAATEKVAAMGPHKQAQYPPVPFRGYAPPRPPEVVTAAFQFAAEHPEISSYIPCFCGCQNGGHKGNHDCFVRARAANGDVIEWEEHGVECAVCIDVATRSRQMHASGASATDIRAAIEKEFAGSFPTMTPTPHPHASSSHGSH